jgi:hypothetical protein
MVEEPGCRFCAKWDSEIGFRYSSSAYGKFAPLKRVRRDAAELVGLKSATYTPTFIVLNDGAEAGRITGYPGARYFWKELQILLIPLGFASASSGLDPAGDIVGGNGN